MHTLSWLHDRAFLCKVHRHKRGYLGNQDPRGSVGPSSSHIRTTRQKEIHPDQLAQEISLGRRMDSRPWDLSRWSQPSPSPQLKMCLWPWWPLGTHGKGGVAELESLPIQFSQREDHGLESTERKIVGSIWHKEMAPRDDNHSLAFYTNRSRW